MIKTTLVFLRAKPTLEDIKEMMRATSVIKGFILACLLAWDYSY